jgi:predicted amidophosphoribosyltransferase
MALGNIWMIIICLFILGLYMLHLQVEYKTCPHCASSIRRVAKVCRYCGRGVIQN